MAKTGFVINNGIKQIFTTGPSTGNSVVNGYAVNGVLQGPTVNYNQSFVEGSVEIISAGGGQLWRRRFEDQTICAIDCNSPLLFNISLNCDTNIFILTSTNINAAISPNTRIEVSLDNFNTILTTFNRSNINGDNNYSIDLSTLGIIRGTEIYFRLVNLCSSTISSLPSNVAIGICSSTVVPPPPPPPTTVRLNYQFLTNGGSSPGNIGISVNGIDAFDATESTNGSIDVPLGSRIDVEVNAPVGDTSRGNVFIFNSQLFVTTNSGGATSNVGTTFAGISFTAEEETFINGRTSVGNSRNDIPQML